MRKILRKSSSNMERIHITCCGLLTILVLILGVARVESATVTTSNQDAILGPNVISITCTYTLEQTEGFLSMRIFRDRSSGSDEELALFQGTSGFYSISDQSFKDRTNLTFTASYAAIIFDVVECADDRTYKCVMTYSIGANSDSREATMDLIVQSKPERPDFFPSNFASAVRREGDTVTVECRGRVGKPAGNYMWFGYRPNEPNEPVINLTSYAVLDDPYGPVATDCYHQRISTLTYNLTRRDNGISIRCTTNQTLLGPPPTSSSLCDLSFCRESDRIEVQYPVGGLSINVVPPNSEFIIGSEVTLTCKVTGNPPPTILWRKQGEENITWSENVWKLENLQLEDTGTYTCQVSNTIGGVVYNDTSSRLVTVVATTTAPPTTAPPTEDSSQSTAPTGPVKPTPPPATGGNATVIIIVCVVVGLLIIVAAIVAFIFIRKRRKNSEVEEPPEKPYNNHNMSIYNTKPDLVTNDEKKQNYYNKDDRLTYADLKFDDKPRSRRPVALADAMTDYADIRMPQV